MTQHSRARRHCLEAAIFFADEPRKTIMVWLLAALLLVSAEPATADITGLGDLPGGTFSSEATGVNADGQVVVGDSVGVSGMEAFRWTQGSGMVGLGDLPGGTLFSEATGVSADGAVVVGFSGGANGTEAFRWTQATGMVGLGDLPGGFFFSVALGVSADGAVIVGNSASPQANEAFRWTQAGGMVGLGDLPGGAFFSEALGVSADGAVIVGNASGANGREAFRWTQTTGMIGLGDLPGGLFGSTAHGVSADGQVIVGDAFSSNGREAFRWNPTTGMVGLGDLPGGPFDSSASEVSADGQVIVGDALSSNGQEAFRWTQENGMQSVIDWLADSGVPVTGWTLALANGVNADGSVVVGKGTNPAGESEAWIARGQSGLLGMVGFADSLSGVQQVGRAGEHIAGLSLHGTHHRPLLTFDFFDRRHCAWASGDVAHFGHDEDDATAGIAEVGGCHDFVPGKVRAGIGIGTGFLDQDLPARSKIDQDGHYVVAEVDYQIEPTLIGSVLGLYGRWDADVTRGYLNAGVADRSRGETDVDVAAFRARLDWRNAFRIGRVALSPRVAYTYLDTTVDAYTETGGGFPATFDHQDHASHEVRAGLDTEIQLAQTTLLRGMVEGVHRFDDDAGKLSGRLNGLLDFDLAGRDLRDTWLRAGAEIEYRLGAGASLNANINASTAGRDAELSGGAALRLIF